MADSRINHACVIATAVQDGPVATAVLDWPGDCGAEAAFIGRTRRQDHDTHGALLRLEYEVYEPMARKLLEQMADDAAGRWGCQAIRIVHAQGAVGLGEASVVIQVAAPHRAEAFAACRYLIDRIKHELPVWKTEVWQRGRTRVEGCCAASEADRHVIQASAPSAPSHEEASGPSHAEASAPSHAEAGP